MSFVGKFTPQLIIIIDEYSIYHIHRFHRYNVGNHIEDLVLSIFEEEYKILISNIPEESTNLGLGMWSMPILSFCSAN